jgi:hypothetical protein
MTKTELLEDGSVVWRALTAPSRGFGEAVERRRAVTALAVATAASLLLAAVALPRIDWDAAAAAKLAAAGPQAQDTTQHDREEAVVTARKLGHIAGWAGAAVSPSLLALGAAAFLFVGFRVAGTRPGFKETLAVAAHGMLPSWLGALLAIPALVVRAPVAPDALARLLPSSAAAFLPSGAPPPLTAGLSSIELFTIWGVALVAIGMARASGASRARAFAVTIVLFVAYVALFKVVPSASVAAGPGGVP